jgi:hypothetical protein
LLNLYVPVKGVLGVWQNSTTYIVGNVLVDQVDGFLYRVEIDHVSGASPTTFAGDRAANPTYWSLATTIERFAGSWVAATEYKVAEFVSNGNQYAICKEAHESGVDFDVDVAAGKWDVLIDIQNLNDVVLRNYSEQMQTIAAAGATRSLSLANGNVFDVTMDQSCVFSFTGAIATSGVASSFTLILRQGGAGGWTATWPASVKWPQSVTPELSVAAAAIDVFSFLTPDNGTTWLGFTGGINFG